MFREGGNSGKQDVPEQLIFIYIYNMYYCMTLGGQYREIFRSRSTVSARPKGRTIPRSRTKYFPVFADPRIAIIDLLYEFRITIVTGNNVRAIR